MKIAWATDIHLDHAKEEAKKKFFDDINAADPDVVLITGDITQANYMERDLLLLATKIRTVVLYCLGNHDVYHNSIVGAKEQARKFNREHNSLTLLDDNIIWPVSEKTAIIGNTGWYDCRLGNTRTSNSVQLADFAYVADLKHLYYMKALMFERMNQLGDEAAAYFAKLLPEAFEKYDKVILATHVPPFQEICTYRNQPSDPDFLPFFSCKALGDLLIKEMKERPDKELLVLSGHTHDKAEAQILPNLKAKAGRAYYGQIFFEMLEE